MWFIVDVGRYKETFQKDFFYKNKYIYIKKRQKIFSILIEADNTLWDMTRYFLPKSFMFLYIHISQTSK